ncbi:MAG: inositol monophosphatase family protein [Pseudomonadota bacterium]
MNDFQERFQTAQEVCNLAGQEALRFFSDTVALKVDVKGKQDWVSEADVAVETFVRDLLERAWLSDGIIGEEHDPKTGESGFKWVIDPIDGTTNFINGIPAWTVVLAGVANGQTEIAAIYDPSADEMFAALRAQGATLNGHPITTARGVGLAEGSVGVGYSNRVETMNVLPVVEKLLQRGTMFHRNASGALSLAYVAAGRLLGYVEEHMNAWDCLAGQLLVKEAGGGVETQDADEMIAHGGRVVVGCADVFDDLLGIADASWSPLIGK